MLCLQCGFSGAIQSTDFKLDMVSVFLHVCQLKFDRCDRLVFVTTLRIYFHLSLLFLCLYLHSFLLPATFCSHKDSDSDQEHEEQVKAATASSSQLIIRFSALTISTKWVFAMSQLVYGIVDKITISLRYINECDVQYLFSVVFTKQLCGCFLLSHGHVIKLTVSHSMCSLSDRQNL